MKPYNAVQLMWMSCYVKWNHFSKFVIVLCIFADNINAFKALLGHLPQVEVICYAVQSGMSWL